MSELPRQNIPEQSSPEGFNKAVPPQAQNVYRLIEDYHDTIQTVTGEDISDLGAEADAWMAAEDIAEQVAHNPEVPIVDYQLDLLAAVEAHAATFKATSSFTAEQNRAVDTLGEVSAAGIVLDLANERRNRMNAATDPKKKVALGLEVAELDEYADMLVNDEASFDITGIDRAVDAYKYGGNNLDSNAKSHMDTKSNAFFAKYAREVVTKVAPSAEQNEGLLSSSELAAAKERFKKMNMSTGPSRQTAQSKSTGNQTSQQAEQQQTVEDARSKVESAQNREIFDDIVRFGKNRTQLNMDVKGGFQFIGDGPKADAKNSVIPEHIRKESERNPDWRLHLNEAVMFSDVTEPRTRVVTKERLVKGRFGRSHTQEYNETEEIPDSGRPVMIRNEQTGQDEPATRFRYQFAYSGPAGSSGNLPKYKEYNGNRSNSQHVLVGLDLPKSVATKLQDLIQKDPTSVRSLVEKLVLENNNGSINEAMWRSGSGADNQIRPPYEKLPNDWNIALITATESTGWRGVRNHQVQQLAAAA
jgi:hypothetical protein